MSVVHLKRGEKELKFNTKDVVVSCLLLADSTSTVVQWPLVSIGTANFFQARFSLLRGTNLLKDMQMVHWKSFIMRGFSLLGEFIIGGSTLQNIWFVGYCSKYMVVMALPLCCLVEVCIRPSMVRLLKL